MPTVPPRHYVVRRPSGDPAAARALASAYDDLAHMVRDELRRVETILATLDLHWRGGGAGAADDTLHRFAADTTRVISALEHTAEDLRHYAHRLAKAHEHHGWSLGKLVALGAMVTVGVAAVVVTVGASAPAEAAAAAAAVEGAEAATAAAGAASSGAAGALSSAQSALAAIRPLTPFVLPHLVSAGASTGLDAAGQLLTTRHLDPHSLEVSAAMGFAGSGVGTAVERALAERASVLRRIAEAGTWAAGATVGAYADGGDLDPLDVAAVGITGFIARDIRLGVDEARLAWKLHVPQLPVGFASQREWRRFVTSLYDDLDRAGYRDAVVALQCSAGKVAWLIYPSIESVDETTAGLVIVPRP